MVLLVKGLTSKISRTFNLTTLVTALSLCSYSLCSVSECRTPYSHSLIAVIRREQVQFEYEERLRV